MKKTLLLLLIILAASAATSYLYADSIDADFLAEREFTRIYTLNADDREVVSNLGFAIDTVDLEAGTMEAWVPRDLLPRLKELGLSYDIVSSKDTMPSGYEDYHDFAEQLEVLQQLAANKPEITDLYSIGQSIEGQELWCLKISDNPMTDEFDEPAMVVVAMHHAREILSPEVALYVAAQLVQGYGVDEEVTHYVDTQEIFVCPNLNPDGGEYDHSGNGFRMWRKNRRVNEGSQCMGVDLNRNYGHEWGGVGSSSRPCDDTYHGTEAFSEPETAAFRDFVVYHENINVLVSLHTHANLVLYPWGKNRQQIPDQVDYLTHKQMAEYMAQVLNYTPKQASGLYPTTGDTTDWAYGERGIISFTWELAPSQFNPLGFYPNASFIESESTKGWDAMRIGIGYAKRPSYILATDPWKLTATNVPLGVAVVWETLVETNPRGYKLLRAEAGKGEFAPLHEGLIDAGPKSYRFVDENVEPGITYEYLLQYKGTAGNDVEFDPISITTAGGGDDDVADDDVADDDADDDTTDDDTVGDDDLVDDDGADDDDDDDDDDGGCGC